jgi:hypothetical protein
MDQIITNPNPSQKKAESHVDYSEMYRTQETLQLNKRLRKTRNILLFCAAAFIAGGILLFMMPGSSFAAKNFFAYIGLAVFMLILAYYSNKHPFFSIVAALIACLGIWGLEVIFNVMDDLLIETSIHKLFLISLLVWRFHPSKEAELIRKELHFS